MKIEWKNSYKIGHAVIDEEHETLFALARQLLDAPDQPSQQKVVMQFYKHTRAHFASEEALMKEIGYPAHRAHTEQHNRMITLLNEISHSIGQGTPSQKAFESWIDDWIIKHIEHEDARLVAYLAQR